MSILRKKVIFMKPKIFISHITEEKEVALYLKDVIEKKFLKSVIVFASSHEDSIKLGDDWMDNIKKSLTECQLEIIICSFYSVTKPWINFEAGAGWIRNIPTIPMCHSGLTPSQLPIPLKTMQGGNLNNKTDIERLFKRISEIADVSMPELGDDGLLKEILGFEKKTKKNALIKDVTFIHNQLVSHIQNFKRYIYISSDDLGELGKFKLDYESFKSYNFTFNNMIYLFNPSLQTGNMNKNVFDVIYNLIFELSSDIKFLLSYKDLLISEPLKEIFNAYLNSLWLPSRWYRELKLNNIPENSGLQDMMIKMIKEAQQPPVYLENNMINDYIDYYKSLKFYKSWIVEYETIINNFLN